MAENTLRVRVRAGRLWSFGVAAKLGRILPHRGKVALARWALNTAYVDLEIPGSVTRYRASDLITLEGINDG